MNKNNDKTVGDLFSGVKDVKVSSVVRVLRGLWRFFAFSVGAIGLGFLCWMVVFHFNSIDNNIPQFLVALAVAAIGSLEAFEGLVTRMVAHFFR